MEEDCRGGQGLSWAVEPRGEKERERENVISNNNKLLAYSMSMLVFRGT
jgi:hypothetical protein